MDRFLEEVVSKQKRGIDEVLYYLSLVMMVVFGFMALSFLSVLTVAFDVFTLISTLILAGMAVYLFFFRDKLRTEYEYTFTNGSLDFAAVYNNKKRKGLGSLDVKKVDAFGKVSSGSFHRHVSTPNLKQLRWFLNRDAELYYFAFSKDGKKSLIVFEPSAQMVDYIKFYLPFGAMQEN